MALIRTAAEAKAAMPRVLSNLGNDALIPNMEAAAIKYLLPVVGWNLYADIDGKINALPPVDLSDMETALLNKMRPVVAIYAYLDDLGTDNAKITDNGIRSTETANQPRVVGWQFKELKNTLQSKAADATETLLRFLFENKAEFGLWTTSPEYKQINSLLIKTGTDFNSCYKLFQPLRTYFSLVNLLEEVQEDFLQDGIGEDLLQYFIDNSDFDDDRDKILKQLKKAAAYMTIKKACDHYSVRFDSNGFTTLDPARGADQENPELAGRAPATTGLLELKKESCESDGQGYLVKAKKALVAYRALSIDPDFNNAYDAGPLPTYDSTTVRNRGNLGRTSFRF